ncbi:anaerobic sulfite reductase subunit B [Peptococcaceae bacterium CEB3]|nr:anaerobic sulfite reductase subunit B [Peptococcaceae bacterium CEB3]
MANSLDRAATADDVKRINALLPVKAKIFRITQETPDVKLFSISTLDGHMPFPVSPGQLVMLSVFGMGEAIFAASAGENCLEVAVKRVGTLTEALHEAEVGQTMGIRGPYGNGFSLDICQGKNLLFIAGGIGLAPIRSLIKHVLNHRKDFGHLQLIGGFRSPKDLVFKRELTEIWPASEDFDVTITVDKAGEDWQGHVGYVPDLVKKLKPQSDETACILCGPPVMLKNTFNVLEELAFSPENILTTLEMRMKCGIGQCGRCNIGSCYVCLDGPVFSLAQLRALPDEY